MSNPLICKELYGKMPFDGASAAYFLERMTFLTSTLQPAAGYCRFSSNMQREESIDAQKRIITQYAMVYGYEITEWYCDEAKSGTTTNRPEFKRLMDDVENNRIQNLIVHKLDRFSRNIRDTLDCLSILQEHHVAFMSVAEKIDSTPAGSLMITVIQALNEYYVQNLATEVLKGQRENAYNGLWTGGIPPLGYDIVEKRMVINEKEAKTVRIIFEMSAAGYGYGQIIDRLNLLGCKTKRGQPFGKNSLHDLIRNEKYKGVYVFNLRAAKRGRNRKRNNHAYKSDDEIIRIPNGCPAIVTEDLWECANSTLQVTGKYMTNAKQPYLLTGLLVCGECGAKMHGNLRISHSGKKYLTYRCNTKNNQRICNSKEIHTEPLDGFVLDMIFLNYLSGDCLKTIAEHVSRYMREVILNDENLLKAREELNVKIHARDILIQTILQTGKIDALSQQIIKLETEIRNLQRFISNTEKGSATETTAEDIRAYLQPLREYLKSTKGNEQIKVMISRIIDKIIVYRDHAEIRMKLPFDGLQKDTTEGSNETPIGERAFPIIQPAYNQGFSITITDIDQQKTDLYLVLNDIVSMISDLIIYDAGHRFCYS